MPSLLDLVLTNDGHIVSNIMFLPPLGKSDHLVTEFVYLVIALFNVIMCHDIYIGMVIMSQ